VIKIGYHTDFFGEFKINKPLDRDTHMLINTINENKYNIIDENEKLDSECEWRTDGANLYCEPGCTYDYDTWLCRIVDRILTPSNYILNGEVEWIGEEPDDRGKMVINNNEIKYKIAKIVWVDE